MRLLRLVDCQKNFVKAVEEDEAETLIQSGKVRIERTGRRRGREVLILLSPLNITDFRRGSLDSNPGGPAIQSTYLETHRGQTIAMQKRASETATKDGESEQHLHKWDNDLSFDELRAGQIVSAATREKRAQAEWRRKNLVAFLAYEEWQRSSEPIAA